MEKTKQPPAVKIERTIFDLAEAKRKEQNGKGNPIATSAISWFSYLVKQGLKGEEVK